MDFHPIAHEPMSGGKHIFLAEDEESLRFTMTLMLRQADFEVSHSGNGMEAYRRIIDASKSTRPVDLLITDIQMPQLTAEELIARLSDQGLILPIIVITGYPEEEIDSELAGNGLITCLNKPFEPGVFMHSVRHMLAMWSRA
jgi:DNA-binding response OmpR family regulator